MRVEILSDLHLEFLDDAQRKAFFAQYETPEQVDVLVLAGDCVSVEIAYICLSEFADRYKHVVYVPGNHEYYGSSPARTHKILAKAQRRIPNLHWLHRSTVEIDSQRFVGTTMWFDHLPSAVLHQHRINDFRMIKGFGKWVAEESLKNSAYLWKTVQEDDIVVTHHLPSMFAVEPRYKADPITQFYVSEKYTLIEDRCPALWIHGHSHSRFCEKLADTLVVRNPQGYVPMQRSLHQIKRLVLDIGSLV